MHGYSRQFIVWFESLERDENGFVMDFGDLDEVRAWLDARFDHTLLLDADDPLMDRFRALEAEGGCRLTVFEDVGMEGTAKYIYDWLQPWVDAKTGGRVWVVSVECRENDKNSGLFIAPPREL